MLITPYTKSNVRQVARRCSFQEISPYDMSNNLSFSKVQGTGLPITVTIQCNTGTVAVCYNDYPSRGKTIMYHRGVNLTGLYEILENLSCSKTAHQQNGEVNFEALGRLCY